MPRYTANDNSEIFRAVVTETTKKPGQPDRVFTQTFGPYSERRTASAQVTREKKDAGRRNFSARFHAERLGVEPAFEIVVTGYVEKSTTTWERV